MGAKAPLKLIKMAVKRIIKYVHISTISIGDTIICLDGEERTVGKGNIKRSEFMGISVFGDTYNLGSKPVIKVIYE